MFYVWFLPWDLNIYTVHRLANKAKKLISKSIFKQARDSFQRDWLLHFEAKTGSETLQCMCVLKREDNKRLQTLWSNAGVNAWRQWEWAQEGWPEAIKSRYSRSVSDASLEDTLLCARTANAGFLRSFTGTWLADRTKEKLL